MLITSLAKSGRAEAQYTLAKLYLMGRGVEHDYTNAMQWLQRAAEQQHVDSQNQLGMLYANGRGTDRNCKQAKHWFNQIPSSSDAFKQAQSNLAWVLSTCPVAEERNGDKAVEITKKLLDKLATSSPALLDTLAAAYAETGQFKQATLTQQQAISLLPKNDKDNSRLYRFKLRLETYQQQKPWYNILPPETSFNSNIF